MSFPAHIFKAYDIRGLSPGELTEKIAFRVGQRMVEFLQADRIVLGRDMRATSPALSEAVSAGARSQGAEVIDVDMVSTPLFYFAVGTLAGARGGGIMVTASHNPAKYNGLKLCRADVQPIGANTGMSEIRDRVSEGDLPAKAAQGGYGAAQVIEPYVEKIFSLVDPSRIPPLQVVIDAGNGMGGVTLEPLLKKLPWQATKLFFEPDGSFPNHEANPLNEKTLSDLKKSMAETDADLGLALDGDGDRVGIVDEHGETVRGDLLLALLAQKVLRGNPRALVFYDVRCSRAVAEEVERLGGRAEMVPVGHGLIKPRMKEKRAFLGGEISNHFYFQEFFNAECSDLVYLRIAELMGETGKTLSELAAPLTRYAHSGEINFEVTDKEAAMREVENAFARGALSVTKIDGVRIDFPDWWVSVRASNTESLLRLNVEAKDQTMMQEKRDAVAEVIEGVGSRK